MNNENISFHFHIPVDFASWVEVLRQANLQIYCKAQHVDPIEVF